MGAGKGSMIDRSPTSWEAPVRVTRTRTLRAPLPAAWAVCTSTVLTAGLIGGYYALRATSWAVMTDELQVVRLAESIGDRLSPVPVIHGVYYGALSQLYPLLLAPLFATLSAHDAATAAHALNSILLPSAAIPAFLLARAVTGSRLAALAAAALTAFTPWLVLTSTLLTENVAYPAFVWAVFLCHRTLAKPSPRRDALALLGLLVAFFARTQLLVLVIALPLAVVVHELGRMGVRRGLRRAFTCHLLLFTAYGLAFLVAGVLFAADSLEAVVGNYAVPFSGDLLPEGLWPSVASHLVHVIVGCGVVPFVLAAAWVVLTLARPEGKAPHAFAALWVILVPLLSVEVASFDLRFTPGGFNQDRYLFYLAPLFAVGAVAALCRRGPLAPLVVLATAAFGIVAWLVLAGSAYDNDSVIFWAAPAAAFHTAIAEAGARLQLPPDPLLVAVAAVLVGGALVLLARRPTVALPAVTCVVAAVGALQAIYVFERYGDPVMTREPLVSPRDWIDRVVPEGHSVALVPAPHDTPAYWWETELWNKRVDRVFRINAGRTFSPFPATDLAIDFRRGVLRGPAPSDHLVLSAAESRFHLLQQGRVVDGDALKLVRVERPYRLDWATRGVTSDGWTVAGGRATLRFYGNGRPRGRRIVLVLAASSGAARPLHFTLRGAGRTIQGYVDPGGARPPVPLDVCVPRRGFFDVALTTDRAVQMPDGSLVGLHLERISTSLADSVRC
jgi:hypothetical protein